MFNKYFGSLRLVSKMVDSLERIANVLEYFAVADAREKGLMFNPRAHKHLKDKDKSELLHTNAGHIAQLRAEREQRIQQLGYKRVIEEEDADE